jgi:protocatechuate 3,4-dioxygenase beta subunit
MMKHLVLALAMALAFNSPAEEIKYSGTVVDGDGKPVTGATVDLYQYPSVNLTATSDLQLKQHATTDAKGAFEFSSPQTISILYAHKPGLANAWRQFSPTPGEMANPLVMTTPTTLAGTVVDDKQQPVADAQVFVAIALYGRNQMQPNYITGKPAQQMFSAKTSADGRFRLENFPTNAEAVLGVQKAGQAMHEEPGSGNYGNGLPYHSGQDDIKLALEPAASVSGKVVADGGQAVAGMKLFLQRSSPGYGGSMNEPVESGADGAFRFENVQSGPYRLMVMPAGNTTLADWVAESVTVTVTTGQAVNNVQLKATKGGLLEVRVHAKADQKPIGQMNINAYSEAYQGSAITDSNGVGRMRLPAGQFNISSYKEGWSTTQDSTSVQAGQTNRLEMEVAASPKIVGVVTDPDGKPAAGVRLNIMPNYGGNNEAKTDANGHYEINWQKPNFGGGFNPVFSLMAVDEKRNLALLSELADDTTKLDLRLKPGLTMVAQVQDSGNKPIAGASVSVMVWSGNSGSTYNQPSPTDAAGRAEIKGVPEGSRYGLNVTAKGYGQANPQAQEVEATNGRYEFPPVTLKTADRILAGQVLGTDGKPAAGVQVNMNGNGQPYGSATSDAKGNFKFDQVCEGLVMVNANYQGTFGNVQANGGDTNVVLRLGDNGGRIVNQNVPQITTTGVVTDADGKPAAGVSLTIIGGMGGMNREVRTDAEGKYSIRWQSRRLAARGGGGAAGPGTGTALVARDLEHGLAVAHQMDEKTTNLDLRLQPGLTVSGTVLETGGKAVPGASATLFANNGQIGMVLDQQASRTDADGLYEIKGLPAEGLRYRVQVTASHHGSASGQLQAPEAGSTSLKMPTVTLKIADRQIAGVVQDQNGKTVSGANVQILGGNNGQPSGTLIQTDSKGHFLFKEACEGPAQLYANDNSGSAGQVQCQGGDTNVVVKFGANMGGGGGAGRSVPAHTEPFVTMAWTAAAIKGWPAAHKGTLITLVAVQVLVLAMVSGGIFWFTRKK